MGGDTRSCVERLFREHGSQLEARLYRITGNHADAIELVGETNVRMLQITDLDAILDPKAYMFTIGRNLALERVRQQRSRSTLEISDPVLESELACDPLPEEQIDAEDSARKLEGALAELPVRCRNTFWLQHAHGMSYEEIARHFGVSKETVKKDLSKAMKHLRLRLEPS